MKENWRNIKGYELSYEVSDLGNVRSVERSTIFKKGTRKIKGRTLSKCVNALGYETVCLRKNNNSNTCLAHQLVAVAFLGHIPNGHRLVVDHVDNNKTNNILCNLQIISHRLNVSKDRKNKTSKYTGVNLNGNKWEAFISINKKRRRLGTFNCEVAALVAYKSALKTIDA